MTASSQEVEREQLEKREGNVAAAEANNQARIDKAFAQLDRLKAKAEQEADTRVKTSRAAQAKEYNEKLGLQEKRHLDKQAALRAEVDRLKDQLAEADRQRRDALKA